MNFLDMTTANHSLLDTRNTQHMKTMDPCCTSIEPIPLFSASSSGVDANRNSFKALTTYTTMGLPQTLEIDSTTSNPEALQSESDMLGKPSPSSTKPKPRPREESFSTSKSPVVFPETYQLTEFDIMCGRHKKALHHEGNRRFRVMISQFLPRYFQQTGRVDRAILTMEIVEAIGQTGGYFLKQNRETGEWEEISQKEKKNKVGHALRDAAMTSTIGKKSSKKRLAHLRRHQSMSSVVSDSTDSFEPLDTRSLSMSAMMASDDSSFDSSERDELDSNELDAIIGDDEQLDIHVFNDGIFSKFGMQSHIRATPTVQSRNDLDDLLKADLCDFEF